ncbi:MAG: carboxymuconolactone decarboxylase family protein [Chloroflexi bacterium]|nr:carboxymuconolactone decarboxylase family protein [Chloroflexota bacterium]
MPRVPALEYSSLSSEQQRIYNDIAGSRNTVGGPFAIWLRMPELAAAATQLGNTIRLNNKLGRRRQELVILIQARTWSAAYAWVTHKQAGLEAGLSPAVIEAIEAQRQPDFEDEGERLIYDVVTELNERRVLADPTYQRALDALGLEVLIELITTAGFYTLVMMMLDAFDVPAAGGAPSPFG